MKPRFQHAIYPLSGKRLWIVLADRSDCRNNRATTLDAEETAAFWKY
jgi:hypothetical protein